MLKKRHLSDNPRKIFLPNIGYGTLKITHESKKLKSRYIAALQLLCNFMQDCGLGRI